MLMVILNDSFTFNNYFLCFVVIKEYKYFWCDYKYFFVFGNYKRL